MPNTTQIVDILFKKWLGLGDTQSGRQFFSEPIRGRSFVVNSQIWGQSDQIPNTAPVGTSSGVVQYVSGYTLNQVGGTTNSFSGSLLKNAIPFNWGDGTSYNYSVTDSSFNSIAFGVNDWTVDTEAGVLMFSQGVPANMPPIITFYRYSGIIGINTGSFITTGQTGQFYPASNPSGFITSGQIPNTSQNFVVSLASGTSQTGITFPTGYASPPRIVLLSFVNNVDPYIYDCIGASITTSGFTAYFSDTLSSTGYSLSVLVNV